MKDLLIDELSDLYSAEKQLVKALPKVAKAAASAKLQKAITAHLEETRGHVERLEQAFETLGVKPKRKTCKAMVGLLEEGDEMCKEDGEDAVRDAGIIGAAQRVEHYEMAAYGCAITFATDLGENDVADLLTSTYDEEKAADEKLTTIAEDEVNAAALEAGQGATAEQ
ncbi:MAG TPA: ferritin-like domain-containing protein [Gemmatimonadales bacterium]|nr:ferritin-like domain-containing protein [Gemmatimonadales bacterium]